MKRVMDLVRDILLTIEGGASQLYLVPEALQLS
jgi:hypothetical protein